VAWARVTAQGLDGDARRDAEHHRAPEGAVCLYAMEAIRILQTEGHQIVPERPSVGETAAPVTSSPMAQTARLGRCAAGNRGLRAIGSL